MKLKRVAVKNFKGVSDVEFSLESTTRFSQPLTALLGDNGSGKTSVLQAIALTLSMATRRTSDIASFHWHGFLPERLSTLGPTCIELDVLFEPEEVEVTSELFAAWEESLPAHLKEGMKIVPPSTFSEVTLRFEKGRLLSPQGFGAVNQFCGRYYIRAMKDTRPDLRNRYPWIGDVFWFDQHRNLGYRATDEVSSEYSGDGWQAGVEQLREYLVGWWAYHKTPSSQRRGKDNIEPLEHLFQKVFPGRRFLGVDVRGEGLRGKTNDFYFLIEHDGRIYDLAEMSSGEQAVFPMVYEFVRLNIHRSIVLIDELELHLHPSEQQRLLASLPKIGSDCQFIITTHSEFLSSAISNEREIRLEKGCLVKEGICL